MGHVTTGSVTVDPAVVGRAIRGVVRSHAMTASDAEEFTQYVYLKLLERQQELLDQFAGRSSFATYLRVVVNRLRIDWQRGTHGKWRPSAAAKRLGAAAVEIDRLVHRDGYSVAEAVAVVHARMPSLAPSELWHLASQLSPNHRRRFVGDEGLDTRTQVAFDDPIERRDRRRTAGAAADALAAALSSLSPEDRALVCGRVLERRTIQSVAVERRQNPRELYRRYHRILMQLRRRLHRTGVTGWQSIDWAVASGRRTRAA